MVIATVTRGSSPATATKTKDVESTPHHLHLAAERCRCNRFDERKSRTYEGGRHEMATCDWPVSDSLDEVGQTLLRCCQASKKFVHVQVYDYSIYTWIGRA
jgi:hypothetical protein